jgi:hypothetical protein
MTVAVTTTTTTSGAGTTRRSAGRSAATTKKPAANAAGNTPEVAEREYAVVYRRICHVKHGNSMVIGQANVAIGGETAYFVVGPLETDDFVRLAHVTAQWSIRYAMIALVSMVDDHIPAAEQASWLIRVEEFRHRHIELIATSMQRFGECAEGARN